VHQTAWIRNGENRVCWPEVLGPHVLVPSYAPNPDQFTKNLRVTASLASVERVGRTGAKADAEQEAGENQADRRS